MSKKRSGKRERAARKRKNSMRKQGHLWVNSGCSQCSKRGEWKFGPGKAKKIGFDTKLVCGQCRSGNKASTGALAVGP